MTAQTVPAPPLPRVIGWYVATIRVIAGTSMMTIVAIMVTQVIARYVFNASLIWAEEVCRNLLIWQTFLFVGYAFHKGELIVVDVVPMLLRPWPRLLMKAVMMIPVLIFLGYMVWYGYDYASRFRNQVIPAVGFISGALTGTPVSLSVKWVYVSVSVGSGLLALHVIGNLIWETLALRRGWAAAPVDTGRD